MAFSLIINEGKYKIRVRSHPPMRTSSKNQLGSIL